MQPAVKLTRFSGVGKKKVRRRRVGSSESKILLQKIYPPLTRSFAFRQFSKADSPPMTVVFWHTPKKAFDTQRGETIYFLKPKHPHPPTPPPHPPRDTTRPHRPLPPSSSGTPLPPPPPTCRRPGSGQAYVVLRPDVAGEEGGADGDPVHVPRRTWGHACRQSWARGSDMAKHCSSASQQDRLAEMIMIMGCANTRERCRIRRVYTVMSCRRWIFKDYFSQHSDQCRHESQLPCQHQP